MFGFIKKKFNNKMLDIQIAEISEYISALSQMNSDEIGMLVAFATHVRHVVADKMGVDLIDPNMALVEHPNLPLMLNQMTKDFQKKGQPAAAAGTMVWHHTVRSLATLGLRSYGRDLWKELARGFPYADESVLNAERDLGIILNSDGYAEVPQGLEPQPT